MEKSCGEGQADVPRARARAPTRSASRRSMSTARRWSRPRSPRWAMAGAPGTTLEIPVDVNYTGVERARTPASSCSGSRGAGMACAMATPPVATQVLTLTAGGAVRTESSSIDNTVYQKLDGTDPKPCCAYTDQLPAERDEPPVRARHAARDRQGRHRRGRVPAHVRHVRRRGDVQPDARRTTSRSTRAWMPRRMPRSTRCDILSGCARASSRSRSPRPPAGPADARAGRGARRRPPAAAAADRRSTARATRRGYLTAVAQQLQPAWGAVPRGLPAPAAAGPPAQRADARGARRARDRSTRRGRSRSRSSATSGSPTSISRCADAIADASRLAGPAADAAVRRRSAPPALAVRARSPPGRAGDRADRAPSSSRSDAVARLLAGRAGASGAPQSPRHRPATRAPRATAARDDRGAARGARSSTASVRRAAVEAVGRAGVRVLASEIRAFLAPTVRHRAPAGRDARAAARSAIVPRSRSARAPASDRSRELPAARARGDRGARRARGGRPRRRGDPRTCSRFREARRTVIALRGQRCRAEPGARRQARRGWFAAARARARRPARGSRASRASSGRRPTRSVPAAVTALPVVCATRTPRFARPARRRPPRARLRRRRPRPRSPRGSRACARSRSQRSARRARRGRARSIQRTSPPLAMTPPRRSAPRTPVRRDRSGGWLDQPLRALVDDRDADVRAAAGGRSRCGRPATRPGPCRSSRPLTCGRRHRSGCRRSAAPRSRSPRRRRASPARAADESPEVATAALVRLAVRRGRIAMTAPLLTQLAAVPPAERRARADCPGMVARRA